MKAIIFFLCTLVYSQIPYAQNVNFSWAKQMTGIGSTSLISYAITTDPAGNVYTTGSFNGIVDFDPGPAVYNLSSTGPDIFICKLNAAGNFVWARQMVGAGFASSSNAIAVDAQGNVFTTGSFYYTVDFDPGPAVYNMTGTPASMFVSKLDSAGNFVWAKQTGGVSEDHAYGRSITLDGSGNILTTGYFHGTNVDFDPGPGQYILNSGFNVAKIFVCKLNAAGNFVWAKQMVAIVDGSGSAGASGKSIAVDISGNVYTTGNYAGTVDFDPGPGTFYMSTISTGGTSYFSKLDAAGNFIWAKQTSGQNMFAGALATSFAVDASGNVYTGGTISGLVDFDPGTGTYILNAANGNSYLLKLDANGNFKWAKQIGEGGHASATSITLDVSGDIYATGEFGNTADVDPGTGIAYLTSAGLNDVFISKLDTYGDLIWAKQIGGLGEERVYAIALDTSRNIYTAGLFELQVDFDPGPGVYTLNSSGATDIFVHKMSRCTDITSSAITASACSTYTVNGRTYTETGVYTQTLINAAGCDSIITIDLSINNRYTSINAAGCNSYTWNGRAYTSSGIYKDTMALANGCDSIITLNLVINSRSFSTISAAICPGQVYAGHTTAGTYIDTLIAANGCDSVRILDLSVKARSVSTIDTAICSGQNYGGHTTAGVYTDVLIAANGCDSMRTVNLTLKNNCTIYIPNAFTPNNDGLNDLFKPNIDLPFQKFSFIIFNRYGEIIFETHEYGKGWDGTYKGKAQPTGSYVYRIKFINISGYESENNGTFLMIR